MAFSIAASVTKAVCARRSSGRGCLAAAGSRRITRFITTVRVSSRSTSSPTYGPRAATRSLRRLPARRRSAADDLVRLDIATSSSGLGFDAQHCLRDAQDGGARVRGVKDAFDLRRAFQSDDELAELTAERDLGQCP